MNTSGTNAKGAKPVICDLHCTVQNVLFVQYDSPVSKNHFSIEKNTFEVHENFEFVSFVFLATRNVIHGALKNNPEIENLEFESRSFLKNDVCLTTEQDGTNIS